MQLRNINLSLTEIQNICKRWHIKELAFFGSVLREDFHSDSDIDLLVTFDPEVQRGLTKTLQIQDEFQVIFGRRVDLIVKSAIERSDNWLRKKTFLNQPKPSMSRDTESLIDIQNAAHRILRYANGVSRSDLEVNDEKISALLYQITIIGEATKRLSSEFRNFHPEVPWRETS
jgi:uncharacterized protein